ncbi:MAG: dipicolinate synthase subunit DpsA [Lachnospiraceae bacterium]|nr:dipicolinate synthase subunit DpsA [Lachnospiraceae bacterium]
MRQFDVALVGGDARIAYMAPYLLKKGYRVIGYGLSTDNEIKDSFVEAQSLKEAIESAGCIVGGIPLFKGNLLSSQQPLSDLLKVQFDALLQKGQKIFGGIVPDEFIDACKERGVTCYDFMKYEPYVIKNAVATAEGSILEALQHQKTSIHGSKTLVLGYGRCGRVLAQKLKGLGAKVCVCSQSEEELAQAYTYGMEMLALSELKEYISDYEYIYNTIPAVVLSQDILRGVRKDTLVIDIASAPGGVESEVAKKFGIRVLYCYGLPGKYAPKTAAQGLAEYVIDNMK